jgi:hypothetical protein
MFSSATKAILRTASNIPTKQRLSFFHASSSSQLAAKLNVEGLAEKVNLEGQNVLMRVDLNVPLSKEVRDDDDEMMFFVFVSSIDFWNIFCFICEKCEVEKVPITHLGGSN